MKLRTVEKGDLEVLQIREREGKWEGDWDELRDTPVGKLFSRISKANLDHVLHGYSRPFVDALGISPEGALRKLPSKECRKRSDCTFYDQRKCLTTSSNLPWCYEPEGLNVSEKGNSVASEAVFRWRERVYLVVVPEE